MFRCRRCGKTFKEPEFRRKSYLRIFLLTLKAQVDRSITEESIYSRFCPHCGASEEDLETYLDPGYYDDFDSNPRGGEDYKE